MQKHGVTATDEICCNSEALTMPYVTLVTGANNTIGALLARTLSEHYGPANVIAADIHDHSNNHNGPYERLHPLGIVQYEMIARKYRVRSIFNISGEIEENVFFSELDPWNHPLKGLLTLLAFASMHRIKKICCPFTEASPMTVAGIAAMAGEHWCNYYRHKHQMDIRTPRLRHTWTNEEIIRAMLCAMKTCATKK